MFKLVSEDRQRKSTVLQIIRKSIPSGGAGMAKSDLADRSIVNFQILIITNNVNVPTQNGRQCDPGIDSNNRQQKVPSKHVVSTGKRQKTQY